MMYHDDADVVGAVAERAAEIFEAAEQAARVGAAEDAMALFVAGADFVRAARGTFTASRAARYTMGRREEAAGQETGAELAYAGLRVTVDLHPCKVENCGGLAPAGSDFCPMHCHPATAGIPKAKRARPRKAEVAEPDPSYLDRERAAAPREPELPLGEGAISGR